MLSIFLSVYIDCYFYVHIPFYSYVHSSSFYIHLIPETVSVTTFKDIKKGDLINIEVEQTTINTVETVKRVMLERKV